MPTKERDLTAPLEYQLDQGHDQKPWVPVTVVARYDHSLVLEAVDRSTGSRYPLIVAHDTPRLRNREARTIVRRGWVVLDKIDGVWTSRRYIYQHRPNFDAEGCCIATMTWEVPADEKELAWAKSL